MKIIHIIQQSAAALMIAAISFAGCGSSAKINMTTEKSRVTIEIGGTGETSIDWGDGSKSETVILPKTCYHNYTEETAHNISIASDGITTLNCSFNELTDLDVSNHTVLTELDCHLNRLTALNVSKNTALTILACGANWLANLDVSKNTALTDLNCNQNQLTTLDVAKKTALKILSCSDNQLTSLDVSNNTALRDLRVQSNKFAAAGLNALFGTLRVTAVMELICIGGNPGIGACNQSIAKGKGWLVNNTTSK